MKNKTFTFEVNLSAFYLWPGSQSSFAASINWELAQQANFYFGARNWYATKLWTEEKATTRIFKLEVVGRERKKAKLDNELSLKGGSHD